MYEVQTYSKKGRLYNRVLSNEFGNTDRLLYKRYFKRYYSGKPTKRYKQILKKIRQSEKITTEEIRKFLSL
jgi:hypothetical protein